MDWEIKATLDKQHGLIGVALPTAITSNGKLVVPYRFFDNFYSGFAHWLTWDQLFANRQANISVLQQAIELTRSGLINTKGLLLPAVFRGGVTVGIPAKGIYETTSRARAFGAVIVAGEVRRIRLPDPEYLASLKSKSKGSASTWL